jgi:hypothetical protein
MKKREKHGRASSWNVEDNNNHTLPLLLWLLFFFLLLLCTFFYWVEVCVCMYVCVYT